MSRFTAPWALLFALVFIAAASFAACGTEELQPLNRDGGLFADGFPDPNSFELFFDPKEATLVVDATGPKTATFVLKATSHGITREVTPEATAFDRPDIAKLALGSSPPTLTTTGTYAGTGTLKGAYKGKEASATLTVKVVGEEIAPGVDPAAVAALKATPLGQDQAFSTLLYPYDQTFWPLGLTAPLLMWNAPAAGDVYRVHLEQSNYTYDGFFNVGQPGQQRITQLIWDRMTASNAGDPFRLELSRYDSAAKVAYSSAKQTWTIAHASLRGAIYYWTTSNGGHMSSLRPGTGSAPQPVNGGVCMGCHAVSADGTTLVASIDQGGTRPWYTFSLPAATQVYATTEQIVSGNLAVNPDGTYIVYGLDKLSIANAKTGQTFPTSGLETLQPVAPNTGWGMPAFAPGGRLLAAIEGETSWPNINGDAARLVLLDFDPAVPSFSNLRGLANAAQFPADEKRIGYPTFTPDSQWIAFHVGDHSTGCDGACSDTGQQRGHIWLQNISGAPAVRLDNLTDPSLNPDDDDRSYEPTFNPIERGGYNWVVITSSRDWGNSLVGTPNNGKKRLWVGAINKAPGVDDPSHPPFYLEGQEANTTNMRGFWTLAKCTPSTAAGTAPADDAGSGCGGGFECCSGFCDQGVCVDVGAVACVPTGGACKSDPDCCDAPAVRCINGICKTEGPK